MVHLKSGNYDLRDDPRSDRPSEVNDAELFQSV